VATLVDFYSLAAKRAAFNRTVSRVGHEVQRVVGMTPDLL
jgi:hypothetical protein